MSKLRSGKELQPYHARLKRSGSVRGLATLDKASRKHRTHKSVYHASTLRSNSIQALPPEILQEIFKWAKCERRIPRPDCTYDERGVHIIFSQTLSDPNEEHPSYKSFRQVCRMWHNIATPLLFHTITLLFHVNSWANLDNICSRPYLAQHVRIIQVDTSKPLPLHNLNEWQLYTHRELKIRKSGLSRPWGGPLAVGCLDVENAYNRYLYWSHGEEGMNALWAAGSTPRLRIHLLPNLKRIETIGRDELAVVKIHFGKLMLRGCYVPTYENKTRRETETMLSRSFWRSERVEVSDHLPMFSKAFNSLQKSDITLGLREGIEMINMHASMPLQCLRRLEFQLVVEAGYSGTSPFLQPDRTPKASWVHGFEHLEELSMIVAPYCRDHRSTFSLFCRVILPRIREVHLKRARLTYIWLDAFLQNHRETIRNLCIEEPRMAAEDWTTFRLQEQESNWSAMGKNLQLSEGCLYE